MALFPGPLAAFLGQDLRCLLGTLSHIIHKVSCSLLSSCGVPGQDLRSLCLLAACLSSSGGPRVPFQQIYALSVSLAHHGTVILSLATVGLLPIKSRPTYARPLAAALLVTATRPPQEIHDDDALPQDAHDNFTSARLFLKTSTTTTHFPMILRPLLLTRRDAFLRWLPSHALAVSIKIYAVCLRLIRKVALFLWRSILAGFTFKICATLSTVVRPFLLASCVLL
ncbi:expressed unknown protein [Seminavis robusta]|uniref:Uncharacterized protein n=1 Tax=Seminavis robusta TaxID=568900 RepID=A0A9N8H6C6_9STRA|nr:expressed unknown protein [Seminavis robusta]|eukprot:Sro108_g054170.1 n/a (225) ;mRNA; r:53895-54569